MDAIIPGGATKDGENGADYWLIYHGRLPDYYITEEELRSLGWRNGHRILFSNDGLIFVTYDHYRTFYEVAKVEIPNEQEGSDLV